MIAMHHLLLLLRLGQDRVHGIPSLAYHAVMRLYYDQRCIARMNNRKRVIEQTISAFQLSQVCSVVVPS